jgi:hypothetical protein
MVASCWAETCTTDAATGRDSVIEAAGTTVAKRALWKLLMVTLLLLLRLVICGFTPRT